MDEDQAGEHNAFMTGRCGGVADGDGVGDGGTGSESDLK